MTNISLEEIVNHNAGRVFGILLGIQAGVSFVRDYLSIAREIHGDLTLSPIPDQEGVKAYLTFKSKSDKETIAKLTALLERGLTIKEIMIDALPKYRLENGAYVIIPRPDSYVT